MPSSGQAREPAFDLTSVTHALLVAEHLSFRQAACAQGVRQSAVSRRIRALEDALGVSLFERHHGGVRVTPAGASFIDRARHALSQLDDAVKSAGAAGRGANGQLCIGIFSSVASGFLRELLRAYLVHHPAVCIQISESAASDHIARIRKGQLDVAFVRGVPSLSSCEVEALWTERIFVALPHEHRLCDRDEIEWEALRDERFAVRQSEPGPQIHDYVIARLADLGFYPSVQRFDVGRDTLMHLVALGLGLTFVGEAATAMSFREVTFRPIAGNAEVLAFSAVWSPNNDNPAFRRFLSLARSLSKQWASPLKSIKSASSVMGSMAVSTLVGRVVILVAASVQMLDLLT
jgi:DNA-binding transcriptional LysR family regulator